MNFRRRGYSLIEMMVACSAAVIVFTVLITLFEQSASLIHREFNQIESGVEFLEVLNQLNDDLDAQFLGSPYLHGFSIFTMSDFERFSTSRGKVGYDERGSNRLNVLSYADQSHLDEMRGRNCSSFGFFVHHQKINENDPGGIAFVSYFLKTFKDEDLEIDRYYLCRSEINPHVLFESNYCFQLDEPNKLMTGVVDTYWGMQSFLNGNINHVIMDNVVDMKVSAYARNPVSGSMELIYPSGTDTVLFDKKVCVLEIMLRIINEEGATILGLIEQGVVQMDRGDVLEKYSYLLTRKVTCRS